jgi:hypothetical protein
MYNETQKNASGSACRQIGGQPHAVGFFRRQGDFLRLDLAQLLDAAISARLNANDVVNSNSKIDNKK